MLGFLYHFDIMAFALSLLEVNTDNGLANQRVFRDRLNPIDSYNDIEFTSRYRIARNIFKKLQDICSNLESVIQIALLCQLLQ